MRYTFLLEKQGDVLGGGLRLGVGTEMVRWSSWQLLFLCTSPCPDIPDIFIFIQVGVSAILSSSSSSPWLSCVFISALDLWSATLCAMFSTTRIRRKPANRLRDLALTNTELIKHQPVQIKSSPKWYFSSTFSESSRFSTAFFIDSLTSGNMWRKTVDSSIPPPAQSTPPS